MAILLLTYSRTYLLDLYQKSEKWKFFDANIFSHPIPSSRLVVKLAGSRGIPLLWALLMDVVLPLHILGSDR